MTRGTDWFAVWCDDKTAMLNTMIHNMTSDLDAGYNYFGDCIRKQIKAIDDYKKAYDDQLMAFVDMDDRKMNRWCYFDLKRRGAI